MFSTASPIRKAQGEAVFTALCSREGVPAVALAGYGGGIGLITLPSSADSGAYWTQRNLRRGESERVSPVN